jgi:uncharacterized membrane protein
MTPLIFLLGSFSLFFLLNKTTLNNRFSLSFIGRSAMSVTLVVTGAAHFTSTDLMVAMMPDIMPMKTEIVYLTGVLELLAAVGLLIESTSKLTTVMLILFFVCILPANIVGSLKEVPFGGMQNGAAYLYFRIPLQIFFILWTYYFGIRINKKPETQPSERVV